MPSPPQDRPTGSPTSREGVPKRVEELMVVMLDEAAADVNRLGGRALLELGDDPTRRAAQFRLTRAAELGRAIEARLAVLRGNVERVLSPELASATERALAMARQQMRDIGINPARRVGARGGDGLAVSFAHVDEGPIRTIARDIAAREAVASVGSITSAARSHGANMMAVFRSLGSSDVVARLGAAPAETAVNIAVGRGLVAGDPIVTDRAIRELFRDPKAPIRESVRRLGAKQIQVGNWTGSVSQYAATVTRTRSREATVAARHERLGASGIETVQITGAVSENFCTAFIGLVCGLHGEVTIGGVTYPALSSLPSGGPPFHPNCSKGTTAFVADLASTPRLNAARSALGRYEDRRASGALLDKFAA